MSPTIRKVNIGDLLSHGKTKKSKKKSIFIKIFFGLLILVLFVAIYTWMSTSSSSSSIFNFVMPGNPIKSSEDRVNILLLGNAGGNHDGALLTDSIIIASYNLKTHKAVLISVPRDLWLDSVKAKVNAVYEIGQAKGDGLKYAEDKIDDILGIPIHYGVRIDFSGFSKAVDLVEGVDINVGNSFDDYEYPIEGKENDLCGYIEKEIDLTEDQIKALNVPIVTPNPSGTPNPEAWFPGKRKVLVDPGGKIATESASFDCRYEHIHFNKGVSHMDGETALKFVRSRHGTNSEGSDFARSKRQQLVLQAFRSKVLSLNTLANPQKVGGLVDTFGKSFETDIPKSLFLNFYGIVKNTESTQSIVLGNLEDGKSIFINPPLADYGGGWVLIPPNNDFTPVKDYLKKVLNAVETKTSK